jgi:hypothetical protein
MAFLTNKTLFVHVQKTGGMSVRRALYLACPSGREAGDSEAERHFGLPETLAAHPGVAAGRACFGFVRHPVNWLRSRWAFAAMTALPVHASHGKSAAATWMAACWDEDFNRFVDKVLERYPGIATQTMFRMLGLWSERPADYVFRAEEIANDLALLLHHVGEPLPASAMERVGAVNTTAIDILARAVPTRAQESKIIQAESLLCSKFYPSAL